ncbi:hypothetical protein C8Q73DRAFT_795500 [Cubamyces lactineus]|nr:hypothetical protein C8Q73DRAFT_795500 [Cubamyces lactineus]
MLQFKGKVTIIAQANNTIYGVTTSTYLQKMHAQDLCWGRLGVYMFYTVIKDIQVNLQSA